MLGLVAASAHSHGGEKSDAVVATLDPLPASLRDLKVSLQKTLALQLVVENKTGKLLEIVDNAGQPFIRIGPDGVDGNLASPAWYRSYTAVGIPMPATVRNTDTANKNVRSQWTRVGKTPAWGWFDLRLRTEQVTVPHKVAGAGTPAAIGRWKIPVRFDGRPALLTGTFRYAPPPTGYFAARLLSPAEISPGVNLQLLPGPVAGLYIDNRSATPITLFGAADEPFLRIGPQGVEANVLSPAWQASGQAETTTTPTVANANAEPQWQLRSSSPRFSWLEPRASYAHDEPPEAVRRKHAKGSGSTIPGSGIEVQQWEIPFRHGGEAKKITGVIEWIPFESKQQASAAAQPRGH